MTKRPLICLLFVMTFLADRTFADTYEFLKYTPPTGWVNQTTQDGIAYRRAIGVGLVYFYPSTSATGTPTDEFAKVWNARVAPTLPGAPPKAEIEKNGEYSVAVGTKQVDAQGTITTFALVTIVGRGRSIGVLAMAAGDEVLREVSIFLDSITVNPAAPPNPSAIDVDFEVPKGYTSSRDGNAIVIKPATLDRNTPCIYGLSPARPSNGVLESDARSAILEALPGWQVKGEQYHAMRGTSTAGWPYYVFRTDVQQMSNGSMQYLTAMTMAFPSGPGHVNMFWGFGPSQFCTFDDVVFSRLFHSLRPRSWTSDGGKAFTKELVGTWRNTEAAGMAQYRFSANGNYEYAQGTSTRFSTLETRTGSAGDGSYTLRGPELILTGRRAGKYFVRLYEEFNGGLWLKTISVLNDSGLEVRYLRVKD